MDAPARARDGARSGAASRAAALGRGAWRAALHLRVGSRGGPRLRRLVAGVGCAGLVAVAQATAAAAPPTRYDLPAGELRVSDSSVIAGSAAKVTFTVRLDRSVRSGRLALTLPKRWTQRSGVSGVAYARLPRTGRASSGRAKVTRSGRVVSFAFTKGRSGDRGSYDVRDNGIPAGTYRLPYVWRSGGVVRARGTARVVFATRPRGR